MTAVKKSSPPGIKGRELTAKLRNDILVHLETGRTVKEDMMKSCVDDIERAARLIAKTLAKGKKILLCGNGGSAADSQHIAAEFIVRLTSERNRRSLPAIALTTDTSVLTAAANDLGADSIFSRQVEGLGSKGDILIAFTTSGNSPNILKAMETAQAAEMNVIGFLGGSGGKAKKRCDTAIVIPTAITHFIQEGHIAAGHILCKLVEYLLFDVPRS